MYVQMIIYVWVQKEVSKIEVKKMGRPTDDKKDLTLKLRLSSNDIAKLDYCCQKTNKYKSEIIREGIDKVYTELNK